MDTLSTAATEAAGTEKKEEKKSKMWLPELPEIDTTHAVLGGLVAAGYYSSSRDAVTSVLLGGVVYVGASLYQSKSKKSKKGKKKRYSCSA
jgi:hypothetical protein